MDINLDDNAVIATFVGVIGAVILGVAYFIYEYEIQETKAAIAAGLVEKEKSERNGTIWTKP